ncbi:hypothetical protein B7939_06720 [Eggerthia catenaformis]|nr:hypothetical protein B7939_06720 [Eggerthia catenaformis]
MKEILFKENIKKAKELDEKEYQDYLKLKDYIFKHHTDKLKANILLSHVLDDLKNHPDISRKKEYLRNISQAISMKKEIKEYISDSKDKYKASMLVTVMTACIPIFFLKGVLNNRFLIHHYVDSFIAIVAFYITLHQLKTQYQICRILQFNNEPLSMILISIGMSVIVAVTAAKSPFDFTFFFIIVGGLVAVKKFMKQIGSRIT